MKLNLNYGLFLVFISMFSRLNCQTMLARYPKTTNVAVFTFAVGYIATLYYAYQIYSKVTLPTDAKVLQRIKALGVDIEHIQYVGNFVGRWRFIALVISLICACYLGVLWLVWACSSSGTPGVTG